MAAACIVFCFAFVMIFLLGMFLDLPLAIVFQNIVAQLEKFGYRGLLSSQLAR